MPFPHATPHPCPSFPTCFVAASVRSSVPFPSTSMPVAFKAAKSLIPQVIEELKKLGRPDIMVTAGGVIPAQDYDFLYKAGVAAIFGPGTPVAYSAKVVMQLLMQE